MVKISNLINWKLLATLLTASIINVAAVMPYVLTIQPELLKAAPAPLWVLMLASVLSNGILFAVFIFVGLYLSKSVGLGLPILEGWLAGKEVKENFKSIFVISILLGILLGLLIIGLAFLFSALGVPMIIIPVIPPLWQRLLLCFYGGINEEIALRLFLMTILVWIAYKLKRTADGKPSNLGVWLAIIISAIMFGIGHLPMAARLTTITPLVVIQGVLLNGIAGIVFGWLYWKKGLEAAILSHFSTDIVIHVIFPL
jgi:membrane protease YdiL (CAAX protease family)